jgi:hypothetical protein
MPNPEFVGLIQSLEATAEAALGELSPLSSQVRSELGGDFASPRALRMVERSLKMLETLAEKTRGNLDFEEAEILGNAIRNLRSRV